jgi:hypothetical protein
MSKKLSVAVLVLAAVVIVMGLVYVYYGLSKSILVRDVMRDERITYLLPREEVERGKVVDTADEAQRVADAIRAHRHAIATTYDDLLKGGQYDPANAQHLTYSQAINLENYLYLGVTAFGLTTVVLTNGIILFVIGLCLLLIGLVLHRL